MTQAQEFLDFLAAKGIMASTLRKKARELRFFLDYLAGRGVTETNGVTREVMEDYCRHAAATIYRACRRGPPSPGTVITRLITARQYLDYLVDRGLLLAHPFPGAVKVRGIMRPLKLAPSQDDMARLLSLPNIKKPVGLRDRAILELLYSTGIRSEELRKLDVGDIDLRQGLLHVRRGKGGRPRVVPVGRLACEFVGRYLREARPRWAKKGSAALFLNERQGRLLYLNQVTGRYAEEARIEGRFSPHLFRHACAVHMLQGGASVRHVQEQLGHNSIISTVFYTRLVINDLKEVHRQAHPRGGPMDGPRRDKIEWSPS
jgi:integrase/recombinase XerD